MRRLWFVLPMVFVLLLSRSGGAQTMEERIAKLEAELQDLHKTLGASPDAPKSVSSKWEVKFYGRVKFDTSYDSDATDNADAPAWVSASSSEVPADNTSNAGNDMFSATARDTRLGFDFTCPDFGAGGKTTAKVEADFWGSGGTANTPNFRLRHAYVRLSYQDYGLTFTAGQTGDIVAPLDPPVLNGNFLYFGGNLGLRRPLIGLKQVAESGNLSFSFEAAASRGTDSDVNQVNAATDDAQASHRPNLQGRLAIGYALADMQKAELGVSCHYGQEEADYAAGDNNGQGNEDYETYSMVADLRIPTEIIEFQGEIFRGRNLDSYMGGIGYGLNTILDREIDSSGGWAALTVRPISDLAVSGGAGIDDPYNKALNAGNRSRNFVRFVNATYDINKAVTVGVEGMEIETDFYNPTPATNVHPGQDERVMGSVIFKF